MVEVQCSSCHTRYRVDEQVLPEGTPTFKCSRCGHVFSAEPRQAEHPATEVAGAKPEVRSRPARQAAKTSTVRSSQVEPPEPAAKAGGAPGRQSVIAPAAKTPGATPVAANGIEADRGAAVEPPQPASAVASAAVRGVAEPVGPPSAAPAPGDTPNPEELLARPFATDPEPDTDVGENLAFDFHDEPPMADGAPPLDPPSLDSGTAPSASVAAAPRAPARWEVGDAPELAASTTAGQRFAMGTPSGARRAGVTVAADNAAPERLDEAAAPVYNQTVTHSARLFLGLFLLVAAGFAAAKLAIHNNPAGALELLNRLPVVGSRFVSPVMPARMVALRDVHAQYRRGRDGRPALVIEGQAENVSSTPLHTVGIAARLWTSGGATVARRQVYCGNRLATPAVAQMTTHEIEFFQAQKPPRGFALDSAAACPFVIVFIDPPGGLAHFDIAVTQAEPAAVDDLPAPLG